MSSHVEDDTFARIERYLVTAQHELRIPGMAIAVVQDDRIVYLHGFGKADGRVQPITPLTPFIIGSLSKSFTALAIMQLVEGGKITLDAPVQRYLPWFRMRDVALSSQITVRHLLNHTSGISRYVGRQLLAGKGKKTKEQQVHELSTIPLISSPGMEYQYSNTNYLILGLLIEEVSGQSYEAYIQQHIFTPLQMRHSFISERAAQQAGMVTGYRWWFGFPFAAKVPYLAEALPAAFLISCAEDMAHYLIAHLNAERYSDTPILSPDGFAELHRPQTKIVAENAYAMGWHVESHDEIKLLRHGGETANWRAEMIFIPKHHRGIVLLVNVNNGLIAQLGLDRIARSVVCLLLDKQLPKNRLTFKRFYTMLNLVLLFLSILQVWSLEPLVLRRHQVARQDRLHLIAQAALSLIELLLPVGLYKRIPKWADAPWSLLRLYVPDLTSWLAGASALSLVASIIRIIRLMYVMAYRQNNATQEKGQARQRSRD